VRGVKTKCVLLAAAMTAGISVGAPAASAAVFTEPVHPPLRAEPVPKGTNAVCLIVNAGNLSPGVSLTPRSSTAEDHGTIACSGSFYGHRVTGPGIFEIKGIVTGTCLAAHASARFWATIPTDNGPIRLGGPFEQDTVGEVTVFSAYPPGARLTGFEVSQPLPGKDLVPGTCVVTPITSALGERIVFATDERD
jgi:hypothetical protein